MSTWVRWVLCLLMSVAPVTSVTAQTAVALDAYRCAQFIEDIKTPADGAHLLRSMMMIAWAAGYTAAHQDGTPRGDPKAVQLVAAAIGKACREDPKRTTIAAIVGAVGRATVPKAAALVNDLGPPTAGQSRWAQDGSIVDLAADGATRKFIMEVPQSEHAKVGALKGTVLFNGVKNANRYEGKAYKYAPNCKAIAYNVVGDISADEKQVTLRGPAPQIDARCRVTGHKETSMVFTFIPPDTK